LSQRARTFWSTMTAWHLSNERADIRPRSSLIPMHAIVTKRRQVVSHAPSREDFDRWRDDPISLFVFAALRNAAAEQKEAWSDLSWHGGNADALALREFRTRADAYEGMELADYEGICEWAGVDPQEEKRAE
jgi:hypothetical protein